MFSLTLLSQQPPPEIPQEISMWDYLWLWVMGWQGWLYFILLVWMLIYCVKNDPERNVWIWIILIFQPFGTLVYFFARFLPSNDWQWPKFMHPWTRGRELKRLQVAAHQIGNPHQFIQWGDALREVGKVSEASNAYEKALVKEPQNLPALWGAAQCDFAQSKYKDAQEKSAAVLAQDPAYKFGDVSLLYAKATSKLGELDAARSHLEEHVKKWRQPEAMVLLAEVCVEQDDPSNARKPLEDLILDLESSPKSIARKHVFWKSRARRMLRRLPKT